MNFDPSHHQFNSDRSELTIQSVVRSDYGEYICTAKNKIAEDTATIMLHVFGWFLFLWCGCLIYFIFLYNSHNLSWWRTCFISEAPEVFVSVEEYRVYSVGQRVLVSCNVSGHPQPELYWVNKQNGHKLVRLQEPIHLKSHLWVSFSSIKHTGYVFFPFMSHVTCFAL